MNRSLRWIPLVALLALLTVPAIAGRGDLVAEVTTPEATDPVFVNEISPSVAFDGTYL